MPRLLKESDYIGKKYNKLTVKSFEGKDNFGNHIVDCDCDCGNSKNVLLRDIRKGITKSCGCLQKEVAKGMKVTHGLTGTRLYNIWCNMKERCYNSSVPAYENYGGRGITVCDEWKDGIVAFHNWAKDNGYSDKLTLERLDVNKGYSPDNCTWITKGDQARNTRNSKHINLFGETKTISEWCRDSRTVGKDTFYKRIKQGMAPEEALTAPLMRGRK